MTHKTYFLITGILFALVALVHLYRITQGWEISLGGTLVPMWVSWLGLFITAILAYYGISFGAGKDEHHSAPAIKA